MIFLKLPFHIPYSYSIFSVLIIALCSAGIGMLFKKKELEKARLKILRLENEKLSNHSRILKLERKLAELQNENAKNNKGFSGDLQEKKIGQKYNAA